MSPPTRRRRAASRRTAVTGAAPIFAALGDEMRLRLVSRMCAGGPLSIVQLTGGSGVTRQAVTKHLHVLAEAGLVRDSREGRERRYELDPSRLDEARHALDVISKQWDHTLGRLREFLERSGR
jgi:DNA-binding transcriptional ArsR family regulator